MGNAIGQILSFGVGVSLSPVPIIAVVLMLGTPRAGSNSLAFIAGWLGGLAIVGTIVLLVSSGAGATDSAGPARWVAVLELILGLVLLVIAVRQWRGRTRGDTEPVLPGWMAAIERFAPTKAAGMGLLLSAINPKNLVLTVGAAAAIAQTDTGTGTQAVALVVFVLVATIGPGAPVAVYFLMGDRAERILDELKTWMSRNNTAIMAVICLVIGAKLLGSGIAGL